MQDHPERPPIATAPISLILTSPHADAERDEALQEWVVYLNGLGQEYEILLVNESAEAPAAAELAARYARVQAFAPYGQSGFGAALRSGLAASRHPLIFYARCDKRYKPADLKQLLKWIDKVDLVAGQRQFPRGTRRPGWREWLFRLGYRLISGVRLRDPECLFVLARRNIFPRIPIQSAGTFAHAEVLAKANFVGCYMTEVPVAYRPRPDEQGSELSGDWQRIRADARRVYNDPDFGPPVIAAPDAGPTPDQPPDAPAS